MKKTLKKENEHAQLVEDDQNNFLHTISIKFNHPMWHQSDKKSQSRRHISARWTCPLEDSQNLS